MGGLGPASEDATRAAPAPYGRVAQLSSESPLRCEPSRTTTVLPGTPFRRRRVDTIRDMTTREKVDKLLDQLSEAELQDEYEHLVAAVEEPDMVSLPEGSGQTRTGEPMPNVVAALHRSRASH